MKSIYFLTISFFILYFIIWEMREKDDSINIIDIIDTIDIIDMSGNGGEEKNDKE